MTLWDRKLGLILGLALFTFACEEPGEIGLEINPENGAFVARYLEIPLENSITQHEDILSDNATRVDEISQNPSGDGRLLVGNYSSAGIGSFRTESFSSLYLGGTGFRQKDYVYDSIELRIRVDYIYGNDFLGNKRISIHELSDPLDLEEVYLTKNSVSYNLESIGSFDLDISFADTVFVDTVFITKLSNEFGQRLFDLSGTDTVAYDDNVKLREYLSGIALVPESFEGAVMGIHAESSSTAIRMHFHDNKDTTYFDFVIEGYDIDSTFVGDDTAYTFTNITRYFNNITLDKSGTPIEGIPGYYEDFKTDNDLSYIQGSSGVFTKLSFEKYINFLDTVKNLVINRAELVIPVETYEDFLDPSPSLSLYVTDETNRFVEAQVDSLKTVYETVGGVTYSEFEDEKRGEYKGDITSYIQDLTSGERTDALILIGQPGLFNSVLTVNQTVIEKDKIFLKVYYSSIK